jgi:dGTPase
MQTEDYLAPYAAKSETTLGRKHKEVYTSNRTEYQRDRDRIIHSSSFRLLAYKTQVFMNHEGDLYRTRLTHSLEVAQVGKSIARTLRLNEDLTETIALAHDLGHTPFGHAGQDTLNECMDQYGGFEHNLQSLRIVDMLEEKYPGFAGLNLTFESREGILKHCSANNAKLLGDVGVRFLEKTQPSLEAQLTNLADEIAYNNHDIDDGVRSGLITAKQLCEVALFERHYNAVLKEHPTLDERRVLHETIRRLINGMINDLVKTSTELLQDVNPKSIDDVRKSQRLIMFSDEMRREATELKKFLKQNLYNHFSVNRMRHKACRVIVDLFNAFMTKPDLLAPEYRSSDERKKTEQARLIADYIAGMTDRYAYKEHQRMFAIVNH